MSEQARERNARVLGKAVHPDALARLHELFPEAHVSVQHESYVRELPHGEMRMGRRCYPNPERETHVLIELGDGYPPIMGTAFCHPLDNFDRRKGIQLAFRRALDAVREQAS